LEVTVTAIAESPTRSATPARTAAVGALIVSAPVLLLASELIAPREPELSDSAYALFLRENAGRFTASWVVGMLAAAAIATAYVLLADRLLGRGKVLARIAAVLGVLGGIGLGAHCAVSLGGLDLALSDPALGKAIASMEEGRTLWATFPPVVLGLNIAIVLISIAAARAGWVPRWAILFGVGALVGDFSPTNWNTVIHAGFAIALFVAIVRGWDVDSGTD
jgi:hypothetical protein